MPLTISSSQMTLQVSYNSAQPFSIDLRPGEVFITEITTLGQKNRMFLAIAANKEP
jgi:hypothetical protein